MEFHFTSRMEEYYQKFVELQDKLKRSEEQRFVLESKFSNMVQIAKDEEEAHYRKLRSQYKHFLEEDKKRHDRNERIIRNLERIETRISMLSAKTERINVLRRQYQNFLLRIANPSRERILPESGISRERSFVREEPLKERQSALFRDDFSLPRKSREILDLKKPIYEHPTVQKALEKGQQSNEEKIEILDRYLQNISSQRCRDLLGQERDAREKLSLDKQEHIFWQDTPPTTNNATAIADDIMNSIYSRYYNKIDDLSKNGNENGIHDIQNGTIEAEPAKKPDYNNDLKVNLDSRNVNDLNQASNGFKGNAGVSEINVPSSTQKNYIKEESNVIPNESMTYVKQNGDSKGSKLIKSYQNEPIESSHQIDNISQRISNVKTSYISPNGSKVEEPSTVNKIVTESTNKITDLSAQLPQNRMKEETHDPSNYPLQYYQNGQNYEQNLTSQLDQNPQPYYQNGQNYEQYQTHQNTQPPEYHQQNNSNNIIRDNTQQNTYEYDQVADHLESKILTQPSNHHQNLPQENHINENSTNPQENVQYDQQQTNDNHTPMSNEQDDQRRQYDSTNQNVESYKQELHHLQSQQIESTAASESVEQLLDQSHAQDNQGNVQQDDRNGMAPQYQQEAATDQNQTAIEQVQNQVQPQQYAGNEPHYAENRDQIQYGQNSVAQSQHQSNPQMQQYHQEVDHTQDYAQESHPYTQPTEFNENLVQIPDQTQMLFNQDSGRQHYIVENGQPIQYLVDSSTNQQYDEHGQPIQYPVDPSTTQQYDEHGQPIQYPVDPSTTQQYDEHGQPIQYPVNPSTTQQHDDHGQPIQYPVDPSTTQQHDEHSQPIQYPVDPSTTQQHDEHSQPIQYPVDPSTTQQYDEHGQPIQYDEHGQIISNYDKNEPLTGYDQYGQPILYDQHGQVIQPQYDEKGQIMPQYDENGQMIMMYDQNGQQYFGEQQQYDQHGQPVVNYDENVQALYDQSQVDYNYANPSGQDPYQYEPYQQSDQGYYVEGNEPPKEPISEQGPAEEEKEDKSEKEQLSAEPTQQNDGEVKREAAKVMDILDTDTETSKQNTSKISNDTDFDFS